MQITIDTKKDTKEEIRRAVDLLLNFVDERKVVTNDPQDVFASSDSNMSGMSNFFNEEKKEEPAEEKKNDLGIEFF